MFENDDIDSQQPITRQSKNVKEKHIKDTICASEHCMHSNRDTLNWI